MAEQRTNLEATDTPLFLAAEMIELAGLKAGMTMLEPSAGNGTIACYAAGLGLKVTMVELNAARATALHNLDIGPIWCGDFLSLQPGHGAIFGKPNPLAFDAVVMNPPLDAHPHIARAVQFVRPGGRLVALLHTVEAQDAQVRIGGELTFLPPDTFVFRRRVIPAAILAVTL